jgi:hypothetical protein
MPTTRRDATQIVYRHMEVCYSRPGFAVRKTGSAYRASACSARPIHAPDAIVPARLTGWVLSEPLSECSSATDQTRAGNREIRRPT